MDGMLISTAVKIGGHIRLEHQVMKLLELGDRTLSGTVPDRCRKPMPPANVAFARKSDSSAANPTPVNARLNQRSSRRSDRTRTVIASYGPLADVTLPEIVGLEQFGGKIIHTARWDHDYDFNDRSVAVIGTGLTAVQVIPELVKQTGPAGRVRVFQRTAGWLFPRASTATPPGVQAIFGRVPALQRMSRSAMLRMSETAA